MGERLEITDLRHGSRRIVAVDRDRLVLGGAADADIVLEGAAAGASLLLQRLEQGYRIQPSRAGATVDVNGRELFCRDLRGGDVIEFGGHRLEWLADSDVPLPPPPPPPPAPRAPAAARANRGLERRPVSPAVARVRAAPTRGNQWLVVGPVVGVIVLLAVLVLRSCSHSTWPSTPQNYLQQARAQYENLLFDEALGSLDSALRDATGSTRDEVLALQKEIQQAMLRRLDDSKVVSARRDLDLVFNYEARWLTPPERASRPTARQALREADEWLQKHGAVCQRHPGGAPMLRSVEDLRQRHGALAALHEPDTAADVVVAAEAALRFQRREYPVALARLDAFLARSPDPVVIAARAKILDEGSTWLDEQMKLIDGLLRRGDHGNARRDLESLRKNSVLPEWLDRLAAREAQLPK